MAEKKKVKYTENIGKEVKTGEIEWELGTLEEVEENKEG